MGLEQFVAVCSVRQYDLCCSVTLALVVKNNCRILAERYDYMRKKSFSKITQDCISWRAICLFLWTLFRSFDENWWMIQTHTGAPFCIVVLWIYINGGKYETTLVRLQSSKQLWDRWMGRSSDIQTGSQNVLARQKHIDFNHNVHKWEVEGLVSNWPGPI